MNAIEEDSVSTSRSCDDEDHFSHCSSSTLVVSDENETETEASQACSRRQGAKTTVESMPVVVELGFLLA